jgi:hypothetical protein
MGRFLAASAIINLIVAGLTRGQVRAELEAARTSDLVGQTLAIEAKRQEWLKAMNSVLGQRQPTLEEFAEWQRTGASIFEDLEQILRGFSRLSPNMLAKLGMSPERVTELIGLARSYGGQIRATPPPGSRLLPPPTEVSGGLVVSRGNALEIVNPNAPGSDPASLARQMRRAGYNVRIDGGVLRLTGRPGSGQQYLLLPAATDVADPALGTIVGSSRTNSYKGLVVLRQQTAVPPLEPRLGLLARADAATTQDILVGMGRHLSTNDVREIQGMYHFLEIGGNPRALAAALGNGRNRGTNSVLKALRQFNDLTSPDVRGFDVIVDQLGTGPAATDTIAGIGSNFVPARSVYGAIADVAPYVDTGMPEVLRYLRSWSQNLNQAGIGSLLGGQQLLRERPGGRIDFEFEIYKGEQLIRVVDVRYRLPAGDPLGRLKGEVKEVVDVRVLQFRSAREFAKDVLDEIADPPPAPYRPLARLRWLVRRPSGKSDTELDAIQENVKAILRRGFDDPLLASHPRRSELLKEFDDHFDDIFRWLVGPSAAIVPVSTGGGSGPPASGAGGTSGSPAPATGTGMSGAVAPGTLVVVTAPANPTPILTTVGDSTFEPGFLAVSATPFMSDPQWVERDIQNYELSEHEPWTFTLIYADRSRLTIPLNQVFDAPLAGALTFYRRHRASQRILPFQIPGDDPRLRTAGATGKPWQEIITSLGTPRFDQRLTPRIWQYLNEAQWRFVALGMLHVTQVQTMNPLMGGGGPPGAGSLGGTGAAAGARALGGGGREILTFVEIGAGDLRASIQIARESGGAVRVIAVDTAAPATGAVSELESLGGAFVQGEASRLSAGIADHVFQYFPWRIGGTGRLAAGGTWRVVEDTLRLLKPNGAAHFVTEDLATAHFLAEEASRHGLRTVMTESTAGLAAPGAAGAGIPGFSAATPVWQINIYR